VMLVSYLAVAAATPFLISLAGTHLVSFGFAGASGLVHSNAQRGLQVAPAAATSSITPVANATQSRSSAGRALVGTSRAVGAAGASVALPVGVSQLLGHGASHLMRHIVNPKAQPGPESQAPMRRGGAR